MNLGTLTSFAAQFAMDVNQTRYAGLYTNALNQAQQQFAIDTKALFKDQTWSVVGGTSNYALPADFMFEKKVTYTTSAALAGGTTGGLKLEPTTRADLEFYKRAQDWTQDTGTPKYYLIDPELARGNLCLYPQPQGADAGTNNLIMTYYPLPTDMAASTDNPLNGQTFLAEYHIAIAIWAAWFLLNSEPATPEMLQKRAELLKLYNNKATECLDRYGNTKSMQLRLKGGRIWRAIAMGLCLGALCAGC